MATPRKAERRILSADEFDVVQNTHHPALAKLDKQELDQVTTLLRERRDRTQDILNRQRREIRSKGMGRTTFAEEERGMRRRKAVLREALGRVNKERSRRRREDLKQNARKALAMRGATASAAPLKSRTASKGMTPKENVKGEAILHPMQAGRVSQRTKVAQAKRDNR
ncbi:hypothetical protein [Microvirga terricola]|uniref:Uncharacterized protein n=1 Tax=Microvirga terricola TaxID=2719797 RepID=A0ABX0VF45_9HYPH|nr:hypothetical protein [Microvirga terricola]NIX77794.1 hypothetical protein [Microvirga terricola]